MRAVISTTISAGPLTVPVKLGKATSSKDVSFKLAGPNGEQVRQSYLGPDGNEIPRDALQKTHEGRIIPKDALSKIEEVTKLQSLEIEEFCPQDSIPRERVEGAYYVWAAKGGERAFKLLHDVLAEQDKAIVTKVCFRSRQQALVIYPVNDHMIANTLSFAADWRAPDNDCLVSESVQVTDKERELTRTLVEMQTGNGEAFERLEDKAVARRVALVEQALEGQEIEVIPNAAERADNFEELLAAAVEQAKQEKEVTA